MMSNLKFGSPLKLELLLPPDPGSLDNFMIKKGINLKFGDISKVITFHISQLKKSPMEKRLGIIR